MFADDTTLITREPFLREVERISTETTLAWGEKTNNKKTERIIFGQREEVPQEDVAFEPGVLILQYQDQSKVVGVIIHKTGRHEADTDPSFNSGKQGLEETVSTTPAAISCSSGPWACHPGNGAREFTLRHRNKTSQQEVPAEIPSLF